MAAIGFLIVINVLVLMAGATPLDDYVKKYDPHYNYTLITSTSGAGYSIYYLNMTSQKWKSEHVVSQPIWWHYLAIIIPKKINYTNSALLYIDGGSDSRKLPDPPPFEIPLLAAVANSTGTVVGHLAMIPNQPIVFKDDPSKKRRKEDDLIAWSWKKFLKNTSDPEILLRLPMTKASVRAMDTVTHFTERVTGNFIDKFFVAGASKRGWTTWSTAAVDKRVIGMAPIVMDLLNLVPSLHHHYRAYGGWSFSFEPYYSLNIMSSLDSKEFQKMADIIDPIVYKSRFTMPVYIISATGDEFFLPDDEAYYYKNLTGSTYLKVLPNAEHSCVGHIFNILLSLTSFWSSILKKAQLPQITWHKNYTSSGASMIVEMDRMPASIKAHYAITTDNKRRDFRLVIASPTDPHKKILHPVLWFSKSVNSLGGNVYEVSFPNPIGGQWLGFFIEMTFATSDDVALEFTTEVCITPNTFPFPDCRGSGCHGRLV